MFFVIDLNWQSFRHPPSVMVSFVSLFALQLSSEELDSVTRVQILDEVVCILNSANVLGKDWINLNTPPSYG